MTVEIKVPAMGESVTEATVARWFKKEGEAVARDEPLLELETDKVTVEVPAPADGALVSISVQAGDTVQVGALLGSIAEGVKGTPAATPAKNPQAAAPKPAAPAAKPAPAPKAEAPKPAPVAAAPVMPSVRRIAGNRRGLRPRWPRHQGRHAGRVGSPRRRTHDTARTRAGPGRPAPARRPRRARHDEPVAQDHRAAPQGIAEHRRPAHDLQRGRHEP